MSSERSVCSWKRLRQAFQISAVPVLGAALLLALLELILALCGVVPMRFEEDPYVGFSGRQPLFVPEQTGGGQETPYYVTAENKRAYFNDQRFLRDKPRGGYRIFCLGGSTTFGRPYSDKVSFNGWLREFLQAADPSRTYECVNAGGISYASYRVALLMEELIQYEPDCFVVYCGQNEFLERRSYPKLIEMPRAALDAGSLLRDLRTYALFRRAHMKIDAREGKQPDTPDVLPSEVTAILDHAFGPWAYERDDALKAQVLRHYEYNLNRMVDIARSAGARIIFVTTPVNLRDCSPFKSTHREDLSEADLATWEDLVRRGGEALATKQPEAALEFFDKAVAIDGRYARLHYQRGQTLWALERYPEAKEAFVRANDEDVCPLRALSPMPGIVAKVARERGVTLIDFAAWVTAQAPHGIPGNELFRDHVHPNIEGHRHIALDILDSLAAAGDVTPAPGWGEETIAQVTGAVEGALQPVDHAKALINVARVLKWGGKFEESEQLMFQAMAMAPSDADAAFLAGVEVEGDGDPEKAMKLYRATLQRDPDFVRAHINLGNLLSGAGESQEALEHFQTAVKLRPDYAPGFNNLGNELSAQRRYEEAIAAYQEALRLAPDYAEAHSNLGLTFADAGRKDEAIAEYRQALLLDPDSAPAHYNLAIVLLERHAWDKAIEHLEQVRRLMPAYAPAGEKLVFAKKMRDLDQGKEAPPAGGATPKGNE